MKESSSALQNGEKHFVRPTEIDVKCGRGDSNFNHPGNRYLRTLIETKVESFRKCTAQSQKTVIITTIIGVIFSQGGRFLKRAPPRKNMLSKAWYDGGLTAAKLRVGIAFRDAVARKKRQALEQAKCTVTKAPLLADHDECGNRDDEQSSESSSVQDKDGCCENHWLARSSALNQHALSHPLCNGSPKATAKFQDSVGFLSAVAKTQTNSVDIIDSVDIYCAKTERNRQEEEEGHSTEFNLGDFERPNGALKSSKYQSRGALHDAAFTREKKALDCSIPEDVIYCVKHSQGKDCDDHSCGQQLAERKISQDEQDCPQPKLECNEFKWLNFRVSAAFRDAVAKRKKTLSLRNSPIHSAAATLPIGIKFQKGA